VHADDVTLALAPFFHILGFTAELLVPLAAGATVVTQPAFDPIQFLDLLERRRVTYLAVPPPSPAGPTTEPAKCRWPSSSRATRTRSTRRR
jgi:acyl-coenzyme A synthetase/AMP-(fatty) acid ligase